MVSMVNRYEPYDLGDVLPVALLQENPFKAVVMRGCIAYRLPLKQAEVDEVWREVRSDWSDADGRALFWVKEIGSTRIRWNRILGRLGLKRRWLVAGRGDGERCRGG
jgi:hypothetical protein